MAERFSLAYRRWRDAAGELLEAHRSFQESTAPGCSASEAENAAILFSANVDTTTLRFRDMLAASQETFWSRTLNEVNGSLDNKDSLPDPTRGK